MTQTTERPRAIAAKGFAVVLVLIGAAYAWGGGQLAALGGSWYFLITGLAVIVSAALVWRGSSWGGWLYAAMLVWTWVWAVSEVGVDF